MKNLIYTGIFLITGVMFAQEKPRSMTETTEVKTVKIDNGQEVVKNKVKVTTREEKQIKLDKDDAGKVNQDRVIHDDKKVVKTIEIDNDNDPFYDSEIELVTYVRDGEEYSFVKNANGFDVSGSSNNKNFGNATRSSIDDKYYLFNNEDYSGIGYFDDDGNFNIEYFDRSTNAIMISKFLSSNASK